MRKSNAIKIKNNSYSFKIVIALISLIVGILLFIFLLKFEAVSLEAYQTKQVLVSLRNMASGESIKKSDIRKYFKVVDVNEDCALEGFSSIEQMEEWAEDKDGIILCENIKEKEIIYPEKFIVIDERVMQYENPIEVGVKVDSYEYCVGGILRTGDIVDLSVVNLDSESEVLLEDVLILKAFDANGTEILPYDNLSVSVGFNIMMKKQDFDTYKSALENGTIRITKKFV